MAKKVIYRLKVVLADRNVSSKNLLEKIIKNKVSNTKYTDEILSFFNSFVRNLYSIDIKFTKLFNY